MSSEYSSSTCYQCGSPEGTALKLCPACSETQKHRREAARTSFTVNTDPSKDPWLHQFVRNPALQLLAVLAFTSIASAAMVLMCLTVRIAPALGFTFGMVTVAVLLFALTWLLLWTTMIFDEPVLALVAVVFPPLAYRRIASFFFHRQYDDRWSQYRAVIYAHFLSVIILVGAIYGLSSFSLQTIAEANILLDTKYGFSIARVTALLNPFRRI